MSVTDSLEPRRSIDEKLSLFRVMFSAMAAGMSILGITQPYDDEARIIDAFDAEIHVQQGGVEGVVDAVRTWKENPERVEDQGINARQAFEQRFTKDQSVDRYYRLLTEGDVPEQAMRAPTEAAS